MLWGTSIKDMETSSFSYRSGCQVKIDITESEWRIASKTWHLNQLFNNFASRDSHLSNLDKAWCSKMNIDQHVQISAPRHGQSLR